MFSEARGESDDMGKCLSLKGSDFKWLKHMFHLNKASKGIFQGGGQWIWDPL